MDMRIEPQHIRGLYHMVRCSCLWEYKVSGGAEAAPNQQRIIHCSTEKMSLTLPQQSLAPLSVSTLMTVNNQLSVGLYYNSGT